MKAVGTLFWKKAGVVTGPSKDFGRPGSRGGSNVRGHAVCQGSPAPSQMSVPTREESVCPRLVVPRGLPMGVCRAARMLGASLG